MDLDALRPPRWLRWLAVAIVAGGILYASLLDAPTPTDGPMPFGPLGLFKIDKWLHAVAYCGLAGTLAVALAPGRRVVAASALALAVAIGYGVGIEFLQAPLPERYFSFADMAANGVGAGLGVISWGAMRTFAGRVFERRVTKA